MGLKVVQAEPERGEPAPEGAVFFYDLADPECYLVAERIRGELPVVCDWEPVHGAALGLAAVGNSAAPDAAALAGRVEAAGLLPLRLPAAWPPDSALAMRVATYAKGAGKSIAFSLAAFRQAFAGGRDLADESTVLLAAAACEMHPSAVLKGARLRTTERALAAAGERCRAAGVDVLPALRVADQTVCGPDALERAIAAVEAPHPR
jgi:2-hydroxychromene-2-carboxylate isomerase